MDDGVKVFLLGEAACMGRVHIVWGGDGARVAGSPYTDAAWEGNRWETKLGNHVHWWGDMYLQDGLPNRRGPRNCPVKG